MRLEEEMVQTELRKTIAEANKAEDLTAPLGTNVEVKGQSARQLDSSSR